MLRRYRQILRDTINSIEGHNAPRDLWLKTTLWSIIALLCFALYILLSTAATGFEITNRAFAQTGFLFIGISMIMSSLCYFWDFADSAIIYRKYAGLVGFFHVIIHGFLSLWSKQFDINFFLLPENIIAFIAAVIATLILIIMALISNKLAIQKLGGKKWRALLRAGYIVIIFGFIHMNIKAWPQWQEWFAHPLSLPPLSIIMSLFLLIVLFLRCNLYITIERNRKES